MSSEPAASDALAPQSLQSQASASGQTPPAGETTATRTPALRGPVTEASAAGPTLAAETATVTPNETTATKVSQQAAEATTIAAIPQATMEPQSPSAEPASENEDAVSAEPDDKADGDKTAEGDDKADGEEDGAKLAAAPASFMPDTVPEPTVHPRRDQ
ncbi:hypothetical protein AUC68_07680 [Methyloceanibacter methanicus]|uniref:Uncharacterized protein n=1 Tax=Methyloceanibacter methanicus TaxID=1774968 RepID=A0A1E3VZS4_9HYPH|nr:hypothetical protein AUC68_07680 [Methyloceanibacter methanicus]